MPDPLASQLGEMDHSFNAIAQLDDYSEGGEPRRLALGDITRPQPQ